MTDRAAKAREIVTAWLEMQRERWTNHHCQHGTTCAESFNVAGVDAVDLDALVADVTQALADAAAAGQQAAFEGLPVWVANGLAERDAPRKRVEELEQECVTVDREETELLGHFKEAQTKIAALEADLARARLVNETRGSMHAASICTHALDNEPLREQIARLHSEAREAARRVTAFLKRYEELMPEVDGLFAFARVHGIAWPVDKNWSAELEALRALAAPDPREPKP